ncbi:perlucin-like [Pecten maximus]|uniref:perlucin-like n=1 Tax=Pecten maximus TaxID=6579 RepID=UPI001458C2DE|nr:perlucin-like [Pecten maximus]
MSNHRNTVHRADYNVTTTPTNVGCIALCTSTPDCSYVTYTDDTSTCTRHQQLQGKQVQLNSRVWKRQLICGSPFSYNETVGSCIFLSTVKRNWQDAKVDCESRSSRLLVTDTMDKFNGVKTSFIQYWHIWVGGYPRTSDGKWVWLTGELIDMTMFHPGQPSGGPGRLGFWKEAGILKLDDISPEEAHEYICELL